ncbi:unnamed protein product [Vitrella brassicaformis CCMP3155]|uniref:Chromo domain-containing protein n=1 Tax=Vitrella brassicaformis (strain CCMP3155) TaxID=1169540 RepID=A0A0G4ETB1_VITBC|nr:unnamed protein product [Vitrella brassicaformis CCMP3155]|mmetsp:Transcript_49424/g.123954  ORF Transcript_49424/g.123954 Transcript_49424/m.123954 type:complete len:250 (-) Transcript_49424:68-817(-)|eukprot:CEM01477.1 unnamed protein product [Vitrella brassicaformis CCMP3155]
MTRPGPIKPGPIKTAEGDEEYKWEDIRKYDTREGVAGKREDIWYVKWQGWPESANTWEPTSNFTYMTPKLKKLMDAAKAKAKEAPPAARGKKGGRSASAPATRGRPAKAEPKAKAKAAGAGGGKGKRTTKPAIEKKGRAKGGRGKAAAAAAASAAAAAAAEHEPDEEEEHVVHVVLKYKKKTQRWGVSSDMTMERLIEGHCPTALNKEEGVVLKHEGEAQEGHVTVGMLTKEAGTNEVELEFAQESAGW